MNSISLGVFLDDFTILDFYHENGSPYDIPCKIKICSGCFLETTIAPTSSCWVNYHNIFTGTSLFHQNVTLTTVQNKESWHFQFDALSFLKEHGVEINEERNKLNFKLLQQAQKNNALPFHYLTSKGVYLGYEARLLPSRLKEYCYQANGDRTISMKFFAKSFILNGRTINEITWKTVSKTAYTKNNVLETLLGELFSQNTTQNTSDFIQKIKTIELAGRDPKIIAEDCTYALYHKKRHPEMPWLSHISDLVLKVGDQEYMVEQPQEQCNSELDILLEFYSTVTPGMTDDDIKKYNVKAQMLKMARITKI